MGRSISVSLPKWLLQLFVAATAVLVALWLCLRVLAAGGFGVDVFGTPTLLATVVGLWAGLTALWVRNVDSSESDDDWWSMVPSWQYTGRFAGGGGLARDDWERALPGDDEKD